MKLSLCIDAPESFRDSEPGTDDSCSTNPNYPEIDQIINEAEGISRVLEEELAALLPAAKVYETVEISLSFVSPEAIRELNRDYRDTDEPTDVLSFPLMDDEPVEIPELPVLSLGDIVICPEETARLHPELTLHDSLRLMIAHSFLHLLGYDHADESAQAEMWALQDRIAGRL